MFTDLRGPAEVARPRKVPGRLRHTAVERLPPHYGVAYDSQQGLPYRVTIPCNTGLLENLIVSLENLIVSPLFLKSGTSLSCCSKD